MLISRIPIAFILVSQIALAFLAGCIPIYWGGPAVFEVFNPAAFVHAGRGDPREVRERSRVA